MLRGPTAIGLTARTCLFFCLKYAEADKELKKLKGELEPEKVISAELQNTEGQLSRELQETNGQLNADDKKMNRAGRAAFANRVVAAAWEKQHW